jgi:hypothetical protein
VASTVEEIARSVVAAVASDAGFVLAAQWVADRYKQIAARARLKSTRFVSAISIPSAITIGTVSMQRGSATVTGDATAKAAWSMSVIGRSIRARAAWYDIAEYSASSGLTLATPYAEDDGTTLSYQIVTRTVALDPTVRWIADTIVFPRRRWPITRVPRESLDMSVSERQYSTGGAVVWADMGHVTTNTGICKSIELYPYSADTELYYALAYPHPTEYGLMDPLPPEIDEHVLREGALIDAMRWKASKEADAGRVDAAAYWRNEYRAQETMWERKILDTFRATGTGDDVSFLLGAFNMVVDYDIRTGRDEWRATYRF